MRLASVGKLLLLLGTSAAGMAVVGCTPPPGPPRTGADEASNDAPPGDRAADVGAESDGQGSRPGAPAAENGAADENDGAANENEGQVPRTEALAPDLQQLAVDLLAHNLCDELRDSFMGIGEAENGAGGGGLEPTPSVGTLWIEQCNAEAVGQDVAVDVAGRGWMWIDEQQDEAGATFVVREYLPFETEVWIRGRPTAGYDRQRRIASVWLTPTRSVRARLVPLRRPEVETEGLWSGVLRGAVAVFTAHPVDARAAEDVEEEGTEQLEGELQEGMTVALNLCTGQQYQAEELLPEGQRPRHAFEGVPEPWLANELVELQPGGLSVEGPWDEQGPVVLRMEVLAGPGLRARLMCMEEARRLADAYLQGERLPSPRVLVDRHLRTGERAEETVRADCELALVTVVPRQEPAATTFRFLISPRDPQPQPLVDCSAER